jgi:hypothetical protein
MKSLIAVVSSILFAAQFIAAQTVMKVSLITGSDDLRDGNNAFITVNYSNGTTSPEYRIGGGFANNSSKTVNITLNRLLSSSADVKNVVLRHDGSPRAGQPFDTYDNWNLQTIRVAFSIGKEEKTCINETGNPLARFTGQLRNRTFNMACGGGTPPPPPTTYKVKVYLTTGSDDLRGGNSAFVTLTYADGTTSSEYYLGGGFGQNSAVNKTVTTTKVLTAIEDIQSVTLRHDGAPRAGQPFDTYENWDLQMLRVVLVMPDGTEKNVVNQRGNPLIRFTGALRTKNFPR